MKRCIPFVVLIINGLTITTSSYVVIDRSTAKMLPHLRHNYNNNYSNDTPCKQQFINRIRINLPLADMKNDNNENEIASYTTIQTKTTATTTTTDKNEEAQRLLDKVKQMRIEIAALTGKTIDDVEREAYEKKQLQIEKEQEQKERVSAIKKSNNLQPHQNRKYIVPVPETVEEQIQQARYAMERAYNDYNVTKQIVRFAFVPIATNSYNADRNSIQEKINQNTMFVKNDQDWPGGIQQIYREATQPYTKMLLEQLRIRNTQGNRNQQQKEQQYGISSNKPNHVTEQILWDFDGSALMTATRLSLDNDSDESKESVATPTFVQALIQPNTDNRYFNDIVQMNERLDKYRNQQEQQDADGVDSRTTAAINLIVNPFWTNVTSWGYNIFAPNAQQRAKDIIFHPNDSYIETYSIITKTVRGEDCIAIKSYPYDWQLYAYIETTDRIWSTKPYTTIYLGSSVLEPSVADFAALLSQRTEFQYSKNMRQMQQRK